MHRVFLYIIIIVAATVVASVEAHARPQKGFHTGPYLLLEGGIMQSDFDHDEVSNTNIGNRFEPIVGFLFGWNVQDNLSAEIQGRYTTNKIGGRREHIVGANLHAKWTAIFDALTDFKTLRILPFLKGGLSTRVAALPGNVGSDDSSITSFGYGPTVGAGIAFILYKYFYFGVDLQEDLLFFDNKYQTVGGVPNTLVYKGGFQPSFSATAMVGVHY